MFAPLAVISYLLGSLNTGRRNEQGASFTEYVVLLGLVVAIVVLGLGALGPALQTAIGTVTDQVNPAP